MTAAIDISGLAKALGRTPALTGGEVIDLLARLRDGLDEQQRAERRLDPQGVDRLLLF